MWRDQKVLLNWLKRGAARESIRISGVVTGVGAGKLYVAPERLYLKARWASLVPYAAAAGLLADLLPIAAVANTTTVRAHVLYVAERIETELQAE